MSDALADASSGAASGTAWRGLDEPRAALVAALITLVVGLATITPDLIGVFFDDAIYVLIAQAIADGQGFVNPQLPGAPPAVHYPPLYPLLLAAVLKIAPPFPAGLAWMKFVNPVLLAFAAYGLTIGFVRWFALKPWQAMLTVLAGTVSIPMHVLTTVVLSEPMFLALVAPAVLSADRLRRDDGLAAIVLASVCGAAVMLARTVGVVFVGAAFAALVLDRRWRAAAGYTIGVTLLLLPWQLFVWKHGAAYPPELAGSYGPYLAWVGGGYRAAGQGFVQDVLTKNLTDAWRFTGVVLTPGLATSSMRPAAAVIAIVFACAGVAVGLLRPAARVVTLGALGYLSIIAIWPFQVDRFLWAVWPLVLGFALYGARDAWRSARRHERRGAAVATATVAAALVVGYTSYNVRGFLRGWASSASREMARRTEPLIRYINADPRLHGQVLAAEAAPMVALYTRQQVIPVERLDVQDHVRKKSPRESASVLSALDRRFEPDAYVMMSGGPHLLALLRTQMEPHRRFVEITAPGSPVRAFLSVEP